METLALWVLWVCMSDCGVLSETRIQPGLTAAQCVRFLDFYEWQQRAFVNDARETKSSRSLKSTMTPNEAECISPSGKTYSTGRWILNERRTSLSFNNRTSQNSSSGSGKAVNRESSHDRLTPIFGDRLTLPFSGCHTCGLSFEHRIEAYCPPDLIARAHDVRVHKRAPEDGQSLS